MNQLIILGAGGHGRSVAAIAHAMKAWSEILFLDDRYPNLSHSGHWRVIGKINNLKDIRMFLLSEVKHK